MIDFHSHIDLYPKAKDVYAGAIERNVFTWLVTTSPKAFQATSRVLEKHESVLISPGLHPEIVADRFRELEMLLELIQKVAAVGEVGLDGSKRYSASYAQQLRVFSEVVRKCHNVGGRAISIHSRQSVPDVLASLKAFPAHGVPILHWFTGTATELRDASALGCWFSIGPAAFNSAAGKSLAARLPKNRVVPESDGPFAQFDNRIVMPWDFNITVRLLGKAWSMPENDVKLQLVSNTKMLLGNMGCSKIASNF
ncbi:TPA: Qat anti-phage system TatD family nuclease QatD [Yersinia enterocolitica]|nr:TatD family hydrolase [Yersinia enterocolitica]HDL7695286.1 TatD family hydrolase [Yersinia enterocolitica]HDL8189330.1 TatD family hydrolase [Yersinia enterocolitica]HDL8213357.1 TatD family hydrolase [Yersinia enterocolitica]HDL8219536.1 TatD family hydrolase [Yersinia enterocolitica]